MQLKYQYEIMEVEGKEFAVPLDNSPGDYNGVIKLNKTAKVIFELLQEETTEEAIVEEMGRRFDAPRETMAEDVKKFVAQFREKGLLT